MRDHEIDIELSVTNGQPSGSNIDPVDIELAPAAEPEFAPIESSNSNVDRTDTPRTRVAAILTGQYIHAIPAEGNIETESANSLGEAVPPVACQATLVRNVYFVSACDVQSKSFTCRFYVHGFDRTMKRCKCLLRPVKTSLVRIETWPRRIQ